MQFSNVRSLYEEPFIRLALMIEHGACRTETNGDRHAYYSSGTEIKNELSAIDKLCEQKLGLPLSTWCSQPLAERFLPEAATGPAGCRYDVEDQEALHNLELRTDLPATGYITFEPDGRMLLATDVPADVVSRWQLRQAVPPRPFSDQQASYLSYHRANRFHR